MGWPLKQSSPLVGASMRRSSLLSTVLPQPDWPTRDTISRSLISKLTRSTAALTFLPCPNTRETSRASNLSGVPAPPCVERSSGILAPHFTRVHQAQHLFGL